MVKILVGNAQIFVEINSHEKIVCLFGCSISRRILYSKIKKQQASNPSVKCQMNEPLKILGTYSTNLSGPVLTA